jgi:hypothetical protein
MTINIDTGYGENPFALLESPDQAGISEGEWLKSIDAQVADGFFETVMAGLYQPIATGFEPTYLTVEYAWTDALNVQRGFIRLAGVPAGTGPDQLITNPIFQNYITNHYLSRLIQWQSTRASLRAIIVNNWLSSLATYINQTRGVLGALQRSVLLSINSAVGNEAAQRKVIEAQLLKAIAQAKAEAIRETQQWVTANIATPILKEIASQHTQITNETTLRLKATHDEVLSEVLPAIAAVTATTTALKTQVGTLQAEDAACVQPMCEVMGPKTNLGKLLKALNVAADAALIAELAAMDHNAVAALFTKLGHAVSVIFGDVETFFDKTPTLATTVADALTRAL